MSRPIASFVLTTLRGGRNGTDPLHDIPDYQVVETRNVNWHRSTLGRKRGGSSALAMTGGTAFGVISFLRRHVPGATEAAAELWGIDSAATPLWKRLTGGTAWANVTVTDAITGNAWDVDAVTFNGKQFFAYDSAVDRLHVWDPATSTVRRTGLATPATPAAPTEAAGAATDVRTYKVTWVKRTGSTVTMRSEASAATAAVTLTAEQATITRPTLAGEGETHWELLAAGRDGIYYVIATTAVATTTAVDNNVFINDGTFAFADTVGINRVFPSVKYLSTDGNRILGAGSYETGQPNSRVWFTPVLHDRDIGDDERYVETTGLSPIKHFLDLNENDGGYITGISLPIYGAIYVFKRRQIYKLVPTGDFDEPYRPYLVSASVGCIAHKSIRIGTDDYGQPAVYFAAEDGPWRLSANGLEYCGWDNKDLWETVNLDATQIVCFAEYFPDLRQVWFWVATGSANAPNLILMLDTRNMRKTDKGLQGGWSVYDGRIASSRCAVMFSETIGATMSKGLALYIAETTANKILKTNTSDLTDDGTAFRGYLVSKPFKAAAGMFFAVKDPQLEAESTDTSVVMVRLRRDYDIEKREMFTPLESCDQVARVIRKFDGLSQAHCQVMQLELGDHSAVAVTWNLMRITLPTELEESA
jgi:hypothetical protein